MTLTWSLCLMTCLESVRSTLTNPVQYRVPGRCPVPEMEPCRASPVRCHLNDIRCVMCVWKVGEAPQVKIFLLWLLLPEAQKM